MEVAKTTDDIVNESVVNAELPPQSIYGYEKKKDAFIARYGHLFRTDEDCEYFNMLPLSKKQKDHVFRRAVELNSSTPPAPPTPVEK